MSGLCKLKKVNGKNDQWGWWNKILVRWKMKINELWLIPYLIVEIYYLGNTEYSIQYFYINFQAKTYTGFINTICSYLNLPFVLILI